MSIPFTLESTLHRTRCSLSKSYMGPSDGRPQWMLVRSNIASKASKVCAGYVADQLPGARTAVAEAVRLGRDPGQSKTCPNHLFRSRFRWSCAQKGTFPR